LKIFVILLTLVSFTSCNDDDEEEDAPTPKDVRYTVALEKIVALNISDAEGEYLEVYGTINSKLKRANITEENMIVSLPEAELIAVGTSDTPLTASVVYDVAPANIQASTLEVIASLTDRDPPGNPHEFLGTETISVALRDISGKVTYQLVLDDIANHSVQLTYSITRE